MNNTIKSIDVYLVGINAKQKLADSTRTVETIGLTVVDICTIEGIHGFGLTYYEVGGEATREFILKSIAPRLIGRDPLEHEAIYSDIMPYIRGVGRKGLAFCSFSAVDTALWDIKGKILGLPLYRLLGGRENALPIYASGGWTSYSDRELVEEALAMVKAGYDKIKLKVGVDNGRNPNRDLKRIKEVREAVGPDIGIMIDANNVWTSAVASCFANRVKEYDILFFEEPVFADDIPGLAEFKRRTDIPLATGEHEYTKYGMRDLVLANAVDIVQMDVARCGGYTEMNKIIAITQAWNLLFAPHGMEYMHMHLLSAANNNGLFLERLLIFEDVFNLVLLDPPLPENGILHITDKPGLGLELNMTQIKKHCA